MTHKKNTSRIAITVAVLQNNETGRDRELCERWQGMGCKDGYLVAVRGEGVEAELGGVSRLAASGGCRESRGFRVRYPASAALQRIIIIEIVLR
jgi:hypothetical protein